MENVDIYYGPKPMEYRHLEHYTDYDILFQAQHEAGYRILIVNFYTHPCAYIGLQESHPYCNVDFDNIPINCHGGLTYGCSTHTKIKELCDNGYFIGWDYAHFKDCIFGYSDTFDFVKKWTTEEIINECFNVIEQLEELKKKKEESK